MNSRARFLLGVSTGKAVTLSVQGSKTKAAVDSESSGFDIWSPPV